MYERRKFSRNRLPAVRRPDSRNRRVEKGIAYSSVCESNVVIDLFSDFFFAHAQLCFSSANKKVRCV